jgi:hypothetical protein
VVTEQEVGQRLETVRAAARHVDRHGILVPDVLGERLAGLQVEHDHPRPPLQAHEEVVLPAPVEVQRADHTRSRERDVRLAHRLVVPARTVDLDEPAAPVLEAPQRDPAQALDHRLAPFSRT